MENSLRAANAVTVNDDAAEKARIESFGGIVKETVLSDGSGSIFRVAASDPNDPKASGLKEAADTLLAKKVTVSQLATALIESQTDMSHGRAFQAIAGYFADAS